MVDTCGCTRAVSWVLPLLQLNDVAFATESVMVSPSQSDAAGFALMVGLGKMFTSNNCDWAVQPLALA